MEIEQIRGTSWIRIFLQSFRIFHFRLALFISISSYVLLGNNINTKQVNKQVEKTYYKQLDLDAIIDFSWVWIEADIFGL